MVFPAIVSAFPVNESSVLCLSFLEGWFLVELSYFVCHPEKVFFSLIKLFFFFSSEKLCATLSGEF